MSQYLVKIVYQIICGDGYHTAQFDEQVRWITGYDEAEALQKAQGIGLQEEEAFYNDRQQLVRWKFIGVAELYALSELQDGAEIFSQVKETSDAEGYCSFIQKKSATLLEHYFSNQLQTA